MGSKEKESYRDELRTAVRQLSDRCLYSASKWAAEQLLGLRIEEDPSKFTPANPRFQRGSSSISHPNPRLLTNETPLTPIAGVSFVTTPIHEDEDKNVYADCYMLSKSYFNCKEYRRACHALRDQSSKKVVLSLFGEFSASKLLEFHRPTRHPCRMLKTAGATFVISPNDR